jgi:hypothetical protein
MATEEEKNLDGESPKNSHSERGTIPLDEVRWKLARLWLLLGGCFVVVLIAQSVLGKYQGRVQNVWSWALPAIMPTLSLIITVLGASAFEGNDDTAKIKKPFYRAVFWLSVAYLSLLVATVLVEPFTPYESLDESLELFNLSNFWLAPFQGFVASAIAVLFFTKKAKQT